MQTANVRLYKLMRTTCILTLMYKDDMNKSLLSANNLVPKNATLVMSLGCSYLKFDKFEAGALVSTNANTFQFQD